VFIRSSFRLVAVGSALPCGTRLDAPPAARNVVASRDRYRTKSNATGAGDLRNAA
jgi:hypothetical protein